MNEGKNIGESIVLGDWIIIKHLFFILIEIGCVG